MNWKLKMKLIEKIVSGRRLLVILIGLTLLISEISWAEIKTIIDLKDSVQIEGPFIHLGEVAEIQGNKELVEKLKKIKIASAPAPGKSRIINRDYIRVRLYKNRIDAQKVIFQGTDKVKITTLSNIIKEEEVLRIMDNLISTSFKEKEVKVEMRKPGFSFPLVTPAGKLKLEGDISSLNSSYPTILIRIYVNEKLYRTLSVPLRIKIFKEVLLTNSYLPVDHILAREDLKKEKILINKEDEEWISDLEKVLGKRVLKNIPPHTPLRKEILGPPLLVKQGSLVTLLAEGKNIRILTQGKALEKGGKGELIKVLNLDSHKKLQGIIVGVNSVRII